METLGGVFGKRFGVVGNKALQGVGEPWSLPFTIFHTLEVMRAVSAPRDCLTQTPNRQTKTALSMDQNLLFFFIS